MTTEYNKSTTKHCPIKLNRLLQLCSANLPVGGFSFSQGLEYAVEAAWITDQASAKSWILLNFTQSLAHTDLAILNRLYTALDNNNMAEFEYWNTHIVACRESAELLLADVAMGKALMRLLRGLEEIDIEPFATLLNKQDCSFVSAFALCAHRFGLDLLSAESGYCWTYIDNQVAAATKLVPLGQTQAQNLLFELSEHTQAVIERANKLNDESIGSSLPHLAMGSAWHETQYSRLFRS